MQKVNKREKTFEKIKHLKNKNFSKLLKKKKKPNQKIQINKTNENRE